MTAQGQGSTSPPGTAPRPPDRGDPKAQARERAIARLIAHPGFFAAIRAEARTGLDFYDRQARFNRVVGDMGSFLLAALALGLHFSGGLSHRRLRDFGGRGGLVSAGRATAILWRLQREKMIAPEAVQRPGLMRLYHPAPELIEAFRDRFKRVFQACAPLDPVLAEAAGRLDEDAVLNAFLVALMGRIAESGEDPDPTLESLNRFGRKLAAMLTLYALIDGLPAECGRPLGDSAFSIASAARRFDISRPHVARLLGELERAGYLERIGQQRSCRLTPAFAATYDRYFATGLFGLGEACAIALGHAPHPAQPRPT